MNGVLGQGVYSVSEASRLTEVSAPRIRRWFKGYRYRASSRDRSMPPVVPSGEREIDGQLQLSFLDLIEIRLIEQFLKYGVGWLELRAAASTGAQLLQTDHPFSALKFKTDGRRMFAELDGSAQNHRLLLLRDRQQVFLEVVGPALLDIEFDAAQAIRWWPLGDRRRIVIDPNRCFGKPVGARSGVPAAVLAGYASIHGVKDASSWYGVDAAEVKDSLTFIKRYAA